MAHDLHGRNVMLHPGRGLVVNISDFPNPGAGDQGEAGLLIGQQREAVDGLQMALGALRRVEARHLLRPGHHGRSVIARSPRMKTKASLGKDELIRPPGSADDNGYSIIGLGQITNDLGISLVSLGKKLFHLCK